MKHLFVVLFFIFSIGLYAQNCDLKFSGIVINAQTNEPVSGAIITFGERQFFSNATGNFTLENLCSGDYNITVSKAGYVAFTDLVYLLADKSVYVFLTQKVEELEEVTVTGLLVDRKLTLSSQESFLGVNQLSKFSHASLGDALASIPGVSSIKTGSTIVKPIIHGLHSNRVLVFNHNVRMEDQQWGKEHAPNVDINSADNLRVLKGAGALEYGGDAIGGIIVLNSAKLPAIDTLFGHTGISGATNGRGGVLYSSLKKAYANGKYFTVNGSYKQFGDREAPDFVLSNTGNKEGSLSAEFGINKPDYQIGVFYNYFNTDLGILRSSHLGNISDLVRSINAKQPIFTEDFTFDIDNPRQEVEHHLAKINASKRFKDFGKIDIQYDFQFNNRKEFDVRRGQNRNRPAMDLELTTHTLKTKWTLEPAKGLNVSVGATASYQENFANPDTGIRRLIPDYEKYDLGVYGLFSYFINAKTSIEGGLRYDYSRIEAEKFFQTSRWEERGYEADFGNIVVERFGNQIFTRPEFDFNNISATAGISHQPGKNDVLKANLTLSNRAPNAAELFSDGLHQSSAFIELGDLRLESEQSLKLSLTYENTFELFQFSLNPYINLLNDFIILEPDGVEQTIRGAFPVFEYRQVDALIGGVDVTAFYKLNNYFGLHATAAYIYGQNTDEGEALIDIPAPVFTYSLTFQKEDWYQFVASFTGETVLKQTRYPDNNFIVPILVDGSFVDTEVNISEPPSGYQLFHFNAEMKFDLSNKLQLDTDFSIKNIFDISYRDYLNRQRFFADDLGRNFVLSIKLNY